MTANEQKNRFFWGDTPDNEDEYYASQGVHVTSSYYTTPRGITLFTRSWQPLPSTALPPRALVCMIHGYGNDVNWTFQFTPIFLAQRGFACFALDLPGHGRSDGLPGFVPDVPPVLDDCLSFFLSVRRSSPQFRALPAFLYGESMGGGLCLMLHLQQQDGAPAPEDAWAGAVLVAPMCKISDRIRLPWPLPQILTFVAKFAPTLPIVPTSDLMDRSVKVDEKRALKASNPMRYRGKPRLGTVTELLRVTDQLSARLAEVTIPFIVLHGTADVITDPDVSRALYDAAGSSDKSMKMYEGMVHSLVFGETDDNIALVRNDILDWLNERSGGGARRSE